MYFDESVKQWRYSDDDSFVKNTERACGVCSKTRTPEGHDPCLGTLIGVRNACCGHGDDSDAYVVFDNGERLSGVHAISYFKAEIMTEKARDEAWKRLQRKIIRWNGVYLSNYEFREGENHERV